MTSEGGSQPCGAIGSDAGRVSRRVVGPSLGDNLKRHIGVCPCGARTPALARELGRRQLTRSPGGSVSLRPALATSRRAGSGSSRSAIASSCAAIRSLPESTRPLVPVLKDPDQAVIVCDALSAVMRGRLRTGCHPVAANGSRRRRTVGRRGLSHPGLPDARAMRVVLGLGPWGDRMIQDRHRRNAGRPELGLSGTAGCTGVVCAAGNRTGWYLAYCLVVHRPPPAVTWSAVG